MRPQPHRLKTTRRQPQGLRAAGPAWRCASLLIALGVLAPVLTLAWLALGSGVGHWGPLLAHVLPQAALNTALLLAGVGALVLLIGTGCAWLVTAHDFPGRGVLHWALLLPLAMPTYIVAFAYLDLLHPIGPMQGAIRWMLGFDSPRQFRLTDLRSLPGAVFVLGFVLYPYVYLTARAMFMTQPAHLMEAARTLGESRRGAFFRVALPLARPALAVGLSLALLETLNDIGASEFLGVNTLTVAVYTTWITRSDLAGAAQIACAMLFVVVALVWLERHGRQHQRFGSAQRMRPVQPRRLRGGAAWAATATASLPVLVGFVAPAFYLVWESAKRLHQGGGISQGLIASLGNTLALAAGVTVVAVAAGLVVAWAARSQGSRPNRARWQARAATLGYAVPGTVLAIGLLTPALAFDAALASAMGWQGLPLMGAGVVLVVACVIRFLAMPVGGIEAGLARIPPAIEQASRLLGETTTGTLRRVHLPLLRPALAAGALLVFVDAMKELPATLLLRPANFDTLATWLYAEAARGTYEEGAIAALAIVLAGLLPVVLLARNQLGTLSNPPGPRHDMSAPLNIDAIQLAYDTPRGPHTVVDGFSLALEAGDIACLFGPSGCGKTTVLRAIAGFEPVRAGTVRLGEVLLSSTRTHLPPEQRRVGMMFQEYALFPHLSAAKNVAFGLRRLERAAQQSRVAEMLALVGLAEAGERYPHELSGGQQQRIALARALAPSPALLLLDEPFSNLDGGTRERLTAEVRAILKQAGQTAVLVTHNEAEAHAMADRIGVMHGGRVTHWLGTAP